MTTPVDVLIIGAGASGAAVAWSLAETKMHILCLEQGDWMKPSEYPSTRRDWEARQFDDFHISPNRRARETDYPINDANSPIKIANFNGVGGGTVLYAGHFPRFHPSDFRARTLDGVADDWPIDYATLEPFFAENDRMIPAKTQHFEADRMGATVRAQAVDHSPMLTSPRSVIEVNLEAVRAICKVT